MDTPPRSQERWRAPGASGTALQALLVDQRARWQQGEKVLVEAYLAQEPALAGNTEALLDLIGNEIILREEHGATPTLAEYLGRFPQLSDALKVHFEVVRALQAETLVRPASGQATRAAGAATPQQVGRFQVRARLGSGAFGTVYRAYDPHLDREVALKVPHPDTFHTPQLAQRFLREARAAARLRHSHIVPVFEVGQEAEQSFIVTALIDGEPLSNAVSEGGLEYRRAARIVRALAEGLACAHEQGIVHRDVKPANIMLDRKDQPLLMDFGLAAFHQGGEKLTQAGAIMGTPAYMAPEQAAGQQGEAKPAVDQYALGVVLYELLTGQTPYAGSPALVLYNVLHAPPVPPRQHRPDIPEELQAICLKALAKTPGERYPDCQALADVLGRWLGGKETQEYRENPAADLAPAGQQQTATARPLRKSSRERDHTLPTKPEGEESAAPSFSQRWKRVRKGAAWILTSRRAWLAAAAVCGLLVVLAGVVVIIPNRESNEEARRVLPEGGGVTTNTIAGDPDRKSAQGDARLTVPDQKPAAPGPVAADVEYKAAEWVLSLGGQVTIHLDDQDQVFAGNEDLPAEPFQVREVDLSKNQQVTDTGLANLKGLINLEQLRLERTPISDAGLSYLESLTSLRELRLPATRVGDAGLAHLKGLANLTLLDLGVTQVSDSGLAHLKGLTNLTQLWLYSTPVSDAGLAHLKGLTNLETLGLGSTRVTDAGLESLAGLSRLQRLYLETNLRITDAGLVHLKGLSNLQELNLGSTQVSDAGLPILLLLGSTLEKIWIDNTHISAKGSTTLLRAGRPRVQLFWKDGNREAVKLLLARGGKVHIRLRDQKEDRPIQDARELLLVADSFQITRISLAGLTQLPDDLLRTLARQTDPVVNHLEVLDLSGTGFQEVYLQQVFLFRWQFSLFAQHSGLRYHIHEFDRGEFAHLVDLSLANTQINNAALEYLNELKKLERLSLTGCRLSDEGLKHLPVLTTLQELDLRQTQVTAAGKSALQKALPKCKILLTAGAADHRGK